jgi:L-iditol 2-dehydrogenase
MQRAVLKEIKTLVFEEVPVPACPPDGLLLNVKACGVCATDVKIYNYGHHKIRLPRVLGHELAGVIEEVGPAADGGFEPGQRVAVCAVINCGVCEYCLRGLPSMCESLEAFGYHFDGGYQEYMAVPAKSIRCGGVQVLPETVSFEEAAVAELLACSINGQRLSDFRFGESVLIIGAGPVGLMQSRLAKARGCGPIYMADVLPEKLELSMELCRGELAGTLNSRDRDGFVQAAMEATNGRGFDQIMICCGAAPAQQVSLDLVAKCGCINFFGGLPKGKSDVTLDTNQIHYKQCRVVGTHGSSALDNREAVQLVARGEVVIRDLITSRIGLSDVESALQLNQPDPKHLKGVVVYS